MNPDESFENWLETKPHIVISRLEEEIARLAYLQGYKDGQKATPLPTSPV